MSTSPWPTPRKHGSGNDRPPPSSPTPRREVIEILSSPEIHVVDDDSWGDEAIITWEGGTVDDAVSVVSDSADEWGADAVLVWEGEQWTGDKVQDDDDEDDEDPHSEGEWHDIDETGETGPRPTASRGIPDYSSWDQEKLKRLVSGYGFRPSSDHSVLVRIATECWEAKHPPATRTKKGKGKAKPSTTGTDKGKRSKKQGIEPTAGAPTPSATLDEQFYRMMHDDEAFWIRILRYEPIAFDELVSRALQAGIQGKKWKEELRRFLDMRGVTYYTADPTAPRRRR